MNEMEEGGEIFTPPKKIPFNHIEVLKKVKKIESRFRSGSENERRLMTIEEWCEGKERENEKVGPTVSKISPVKSDNTGTRYPRIRPEEDSLLSRNSKGVNFGLTRNSKNCSSNSRSFGKFLTQNPKNCTVTSKLHEMATKSRNKSFCISPGAKLTTNKHILSKKNTSGFLKSLKKSKSLNHFPTRKMSSLKFLSSPETTNPSLNRVNELSMSRCNLRSVSRPKYSS